MVGVRHDVAHSCQRREASDSRAGAQPVKLEEMRGPQTGILRAQLGMARSGRGGKKGKLVELLVVVRTGMGLGWGWDDDSTDRGGQS